MAEMLKKWKNNGEKIQQTTPLNYFYWPVSQHSQQQHQQEAPWCLLVSELLEHLEISHVNQTKP